MNYVNTIITSPDATALFGGDGDLLLGCYTLEAVLRFIALKHHQGGIETIKPIECHASRFYEGDNGNKYARYAKEHGIELYILSAPRGAQLPTINEEGWVALDTPPYPVAPYLSGASETRVYTNTTSKCTIVFVRNASSEKWMDMFCSSMFRILPWYFADGISEDEKNLFKAINSNDGKAFAKIINDLCAAYDFKDARLKKSLIGWNDGRRKRQIKILKNNAGKTLQRIESHQQDITKLLNELDTYNVNLLALQAQEDSTDDSVYKFFINHPNIVVLDITPGCDDGNVMEYCVLETLEYYDRDEFLRVYNNKNSNIGCADNDVREILFAIFGLGESRGAFRVESMFRLTNLSGLNVLRNSRSHQYDNTYLPHPHLVTYGCLGGNSKYITEYMQQGNWDLAIEQSIAATKNINFGDSTVVGSFVGDIYNHMCDCRCILADNGKEMTPTEFLAYIRMTKENEDIKNG